MCDSSMTVQKVLGADFELSNALIGSATMPSHQVARCLLRAIQGCPSGGSGGSAIEMARRFLPTCGSSWYIDSDHLEGNLPEHASAWDHPAVLHGAGFAQAQAALRVAAAQCPVGTRINLLANCSDGRTAWGSHLNVLVTRCCFENLLYRKLHLAALLATHLVTSVVYTGQGKVGASNGRPACAFQLSQRADWFDQMFGQQTMDRRPLINLRDEPHADSRSRPFAHHLLRHVLVASCQHPQGRNHTAVARDVRSGMERRGGRIRRPGSRGVADQPGFGVAAAVPHSDSRSIDDRDRNSAIAGGVGSRICGQWRSLPRRTSS